MDYTINFRSSIMNLKLEKFKNLILKVYLCSVAFKILFHLVVQCIEVELHDSLIASSDIISRNETESKILKLHNLMYIVGQIYRGTATSGIFFYSLVLASSLTFSVIKALSFGKISEFYENNSFIDYLKNPVEQNEKISSRIEDLVQRIINSNLNFTRALMNQCLQQIAQKRYKLSLDGLDHNIDLVPKRHQVTISTNNASLPSKGNQNNSKLSAKFPYSSLPNQSWVAKDRVIFGMERQFEYLNNLSRIKRETWPDNRNQKWEQQLKQLWRTMYFVLTPIVWFFGEVCIITASYLAFEALKYSRISKNFSEISFLDRLWSADYCIYAFFGSETFTAPFMILVLGILDQTKCLASLKPKFDKICEKKRKLEQLHNWNETKSKLSKAEKELIIECDKDALNLFICYQLFQDDVGSIIELAQKALSLYVTFTFISLVPTFAYHKNIPPQHLPIFLLISISLVITINLTFCLCATLNASCKRTIKMAWSLVGIAEGYNHRWYTQLSEKVPKTRYVNFSDLRSSYFCGNDAFNVNSTIDFEYYCNSFITPHTVLLWRRMIDKQDMLNEKFTFRLYNKINIDFAGILRLNYWMVSLLLFVLTRSSVN